MEPLRHHDVPLYPICCGALTFVLPSAFQTDLLPSLPNGWEHPRAVSGLSLHCLLLPLWQRRFGVHPSHSGHLHPTDTSISREEPCSLRSVLLCLASDVVLTFKRPPGASPGRVRDSWPWGCSVLPFRDYTQKISQFLSGLRGKRRADPKWGMETLLLLVEKGFS